MTAENKICQNCGQSFTIEPKDFQFYEKISVPPPTFCPECRFQRRLMFRNENVLYKRACGLCGKPMVTIFAPEKPYAVYCGACWWSDKWHGFEYGQDYDPTRNFFEQFRELQQKTPYANLIVSYESLVNSDYVNHAGAMKNCYLVYNADFCENVLYANLATHVKDSADATIIGESELCYGVLNCGKSSRVFFSEDIEACQNVYFSKDCIGCSNCIGCFGLRNKSYHIWNKPYSKEEYRQKLKEFRFDSWAALKPMKRHAREFWQTYPHKFYHGRHNTNVSGDYVYQSKNSRNMYLTRFTEDSRFCQMMTLAPAKDLYDLTEWGNGAQRVYDSITVGEGVDVAKFSFGVWRNCSSVEYSMFVLDSSNIFGCVNLRNKQYCILNKQYAKEEFSRLRDRIIRDINEKPYVDSRGRAWKYGEFFPYDLSLFDYNESTAPHFFNITKEAALARGWCWREREATHYAISIAGGDLPDSVNDAPDSVADEIIDCAQCGRAYRIIKAELDLLRRFALPLPRKCPACRYRERLDRLNPPRLWRRTCACSSAVSENGAYKNTAGHFHSDSRCPNEFETSYAPNRPEIVYCEACYNNEVA